MIKIIITNNNSNDNNKKMIKVGNKNHINK